MYLWRLIIRAISKDSAAGRALMLLIQDEYGQDLDGFDLLRYLARYANDQSAEDVKRRKAKIDDLSFSASESPMTWMLKMQRLKNDWERACLRRDAEAGSRS